ncbi:isochorismatase family protein [Corynebacterium callunae]|uniref:isochorismatase family protein n=1 Tax=Corynebacterium callunae TaxID=1721 RepID=UPI003982467B
MARALIIVDVQKDFCPGGSLATVRGNEVAGLIEAYLLSHAGEYDSVVATQDWHIDPGEHFSDNPDYVDSWPVHCKADTDGAAIHERIDLNLIDEFFRKGHYTAAYSGFEGTATSEELLLGPWLKARDITEVDVVGIATDHCVRATTLDALKEGFEVRVLSDMCAAVDVHAGDRALEEMHDAGALLV